MHEYSKYVEEPHAMSSDDAVIFGVAKCCAQSFTRSFSIVFIYRKS